MSDWARWTIRRLQRRWLRYLRVIDLIGAALLIIACFLGWIANIATSQIGAQKTSANWAGYLVLAYMVLVVLRLVLTRHDRGARDKQQGEIVWGLCDLLNDEVFGGETKTRFTLFRQDQLFPAYVVPWYRYEKGGRDPILDAASSSAEYRQHEGVTGVAWAVASKEAVDIAVLPKFASQEAMVAHYTEKLNVRPETAARLSEYMRNVTCIVSLGFTDERSKFIGVLSIDLQLPYKFVKNEGTDDKRLVFTTSNGGSMELWSDQIVYVARAIRNVLCSFRQT